MSKLLRFIDDFQNNEVLILRDHLALERTKLANERTLFSYLRTSLYLFTAGIGILEIKSIAHLRVIAYPSLFFSAVLFVIGFVRFIQLKSNLRSYVKKGNIPEQGIVQNHTESVPPLSVALINKNKP